MSASANVSTDKFDAWAIANRYLQSLPVGERESYTADKLNRLVDLVNNLFKSGEYQAFSKSLQDKPQSAG